MTPEDYTVALDIYRGPVELLLHLIQENEVDIYDIPIAVILGQYLDHLERMKEIDLDLAGDFLVMASRLMEIKSKMLIPREEVPEDEEDDPRADLVRRLLEYKRYKLLASELTRLGDERRLRFGRPEYRLPEGEEGEKRIEFELFDVTRAYERIMRETLAGKEVRIVYDDVPVEDRMHLVLKVLEERPSLAFLALFGRSPNRAIVSSTFLAILELVKRFRVKVWQGKDFGEIRVARMDHPLEEEPPPPPEETTPAPARRRGQAFERPEEDKEEVELARKAEEVLAFADEIMRRYADRRKEAKEPVPPPEGTQQGRD